MGTADRPSILMTRINADLSTSWVVRRYARWHSKLASVFDVEVTTIRQGQRGEANDARKMAMYLVKRLRDLTYKATVVLL
jgi:hypothetical protein